MGLREEREPGGDEPCSGKCVQVTVNGTPPRVFAPPPGMQEQNVH